MDKAIYRLVYELEDIRLYAPILASDYHLTRSIEANNQMTYAIMGITKDVLKLHVNEVIRLINEGDNKTLRSDLAVLAQSLNYRMQYPVDEMAAVRLGATLCFFEDENPNDVHPVHTQRKEDLARKHPDLYAFFLNMGIESMEEYKNALNTSDQEVYLKNRRETLTTLNPFQI